LKQGLAFIQVSDIAAKEKSTEVLFSLLFAFMHWRFDVVVKEKGPAFPVYPAPTIACVTAWPVQDRSHILFCTALSFAATAAPHHHQRKLFRPVFYPKHLVVWRMAAGVFIMNIVINHPLSSCTKCTWCDCNKGSTSSAEKKAFPFAGIVQLPFLHIVFRIGKIHHIGASKS
jgi:hypothetical protein